MARRKRLFLGGADRIPYDGVRPPRPAERPIGKRHINGGIGMRNMGIGWYLDDIIFRWVHPRIRIPKPFCYMVPSGYAYHDGDFVVLLRHDTSSTPTRAARLKFYKGTDPKFIGESSTIPVVWQMMPLNNDLFAIVAKAQPADNPYLKEVA